MREFDLSDSHPAEFLGMINGHVRDLAEEWWATLSPDDPARTGQGYLLLTVGTVT